MGNCVSRLPTQCLALVYNKHDYFRPPDEFRYMYLDTFKFSVPEAVQKSKGLTVCMLCAQCYLPTLIPHAHSAQFIGALGKHSALKAITFISLFVYKYVADTAFVFISCLPTDKLGFVSSQ